MKRTRYVLVLFFCCLFGAILGFLLSYPIRCAFSLDWPFDTGYILDFKRFFFWRVISGWLLGASLLAYAMSGVRRIRHLRRISERYTLLLLAAYASISIGFYPEISPVQFLMEGHVATTTYSEGFSRDSFMKIKNGMTKAAVSELVGVGFSEDRIKALEPYRCWAYSRPRNTEDYWQYIVEFDDQERVRRVCVCFWFD